MLNTDEAKRPSREDAERAVTEFLEREKPGYPTFTLVEDGDDGWAFWIDPDDTTSYVQPDLSIEWYGSGWPDTVEYDGLTGDFVERPDEAPAGAAGLAP